VFWNLLKNAVKFTPLGGRIDIVTRDQAQSCIEIAVIDNGIGLDPAMLEKIFDAFEQGHLKMTRQYGGLGLGLAISKALIDAHHGTIRAMNTVGASGARFEISLPGELAPEEVPLDRRLPISSPTGSSTEQAPFNLLLVEDHPDSATLLARLLRMYGYEVVTATSVREAVEIFRESPIQGIISDIGLPDGTGIELMQMLRAIRPVPGIALSGYGMESDLQKSREAGFLRHLTKPVDWPQLEEALEQIRTTSA
jgi:CheY-like chemotaxis protein